MQITLKLIATYRKLLPEGAKGNTIQIEIAEGSPVEEILTKYGVPGERESVILVNGHAPEPGQTLKPGDTLVAFPALAGG